MILINDNNFKSLQILNKYYLSKIVVIILSLFSSIFSRITNNKNAVTMEVEQEWRLVGITYYRYTKAAVAHNPST
jgi:hypothetical protein